MPDPLLQQAPRVVLRQRNHRVYTLAPQRLEDAFAERIGLWSPGRRFQHSQSIVAELPLKRGKPSG
jgi:hypothetical protein